jgi:hypothetical protein
MLYVQDRSHTKLGDVLKASTESIWNRARNSQENTFSTNWSGPAPKTGATISQATMNAAGYYGSQYFCTLQLISQVYPNRIVIFDV